MYVVFHAFPLLWWKSRRWRRRVFFSSSPLFSNYVGCGFSSLLESQRDERERSQIGSMTIGQIRRWQTGLPACLPRTRMSRRRSWLLFLPPLLPLLLQRYGLQQLSLIFTFSLLPTRWSLHCFTPKLNSCLQNRTSWKKTLWYSYANLNIYSKSKRRINTMQCKIWCCSIGANYELL